MHHKSRRLPAHQHMLFLNAPSTHSIVNQDWSYCKTSSSPNSPAADAPHGCAGYRSGELLHTSHTATHPTCPAGSHSLQTTPSASCQQEEGARGHRIQACYRPPPYLRPPMHAADADGRKHHPRHTAGQLRWRYLSNCAIAAVPAGPRWCPWHGPRPAALGTSHHQWKP